MPATGAKGLNLAVSDVNALSRAMAAFYATGSRDDLDGYSARCLQRVWRVQEFSWYMSSLLHRLPGDDDFGLDRVRAVLAANATAPLADLELRLLAAARAHGTPHDDQSLSPIRRLT